VAGLALGAVLFWRVWCELMVVLFNIYLVPKSIRDRGTGAL
jgi:hypothetical protein